MMLECHSTTFIKMKNIYILYLLCVSLSVLGQSGGSSNNPNYTIKLNLELSTESSDFAPRFADAGNIGMVFTSSRNSSDLNLTSLFYTERKDNKWQKPLSIVDSDKKNGIGIITMDYSRNVILFTKCPLKYWHDSGYVCNIYYSFLEGDMIGEAIPLNIPIDLKNIESEVNLGHPYFSNEKDVLFFATNLPGGYGGKDIWFSIYERTSDTWGKPQNAGAKINTSGDELYPMVHSDGSLYFTSSGHDGFGGWDIYKSEMEGELSWGDAQNLGKPINSKSDDFGIVFNGNSLTGYFASNRKKGLGSDDIYEFSVDGGLNQYQSTPK
ncbi:MAG: hypothetical protein COB85_01180 [Bacteroidetes bacterium]|nr:MAG: hypothetical protein COB85_01180 [Bacteroidota bacterium]